jgi:hypothetical protein
MARPRWLLLPWLLGLKVSVASADATTPPAPLTDQQVVALPGVQRRIDHLAVDPTGRTTTNKQLAAVP